jgi:hypothetical protein
MTISTIFYFCDNTYSEELEDIIDLENNIDLSEFYLTPPDWLVKKTIETIISS